MLIQSIQYSAHDSIKSEYLLAPNIIFLRTQDGSARLLNLGGNFYAISQIGAQMLDATLKEGSAKAATDIAATYRTDVSQVQRDLSAFLHTLQEKRLLLQTRGHHRILQNKGIRPMLSLTLLLHSISLSSFSLKKKTWMLLAIASVAIRLFGWSKAVASWSSAMQKYAPCTTASEMKQSMQDIDTLVRRIAARHPFHVECKERSLCCWWLLSSAGYSSNLVVGVSLFPLECHCWCEAGQTVVSDDQDRCERFTPIFNYRNTI